MSNEQLTYIVQAVKELAEGQQKLMKGQEKLFVGQKDLYRKFDQLEQNQSETNDRLTRIENQMSFVKYKIAEHDEEIFMLKERRK